jgi:CheY-like chemotaxis protein
VTPHLKQIGLPSGGPEAAPDSELPAPDTSRWVARRKAQVVDAVRAGRLSIEEACRRYRLTVEELAGWQRSFLRYGLAGLKVSRRRIGEARAKDFGRRRKAPAPPPERTIAPAPPHPAPAAAGARTRRRPGPRRLLVIDDEPMVARFITHAAQSHGYEAAMTISADAFRRDYDGADPDVVVVDLAMPGGDGVELLRFLAERHSRAIVVVLSGFDGRVLEAAVRLGRSIGLTMAPPLAKPVTVDELIDAIEASRMDAAA